MFTSYITSFTNVVEINVHLTFSIVLGKLENQIIRKNSG